MAFNYDEYLRTNKMPTLWCWGCGDGVILKAFIWEGNDSFRSGGSVDEVYRFLGRYNNFKCFSLHCCHGRKSKWLPSQPF